MKKVLFLFAFLLLGIGAMAQKVIYDETNQTGVRTVVCEGMNLGVSNNMDVYVALAGFQYKSTIRYSLAVTIGSGHEVEIPNDSKCVLTLDNGKAYLFLSIFLHIWIRRMINDPISASVEAIADPAIPNFKVNINR